MKNEQRTKKIEKRRKFQQLSGSGMNNHSIKCNVNQNFQIFKFQISNFKFSNQYCLLNLFQFYGSINLKRMRNRPFS